MKEGQRENKKKKKYRKIHLLDIVSPTLLIVGGLPAEGEDKERKRENKRKKRKRKRDKSTYLT